MIETHSDDVSPRDLLVELIRRFSPPPKYMDWLIGQKAPKWTYDSDHFRQISNLLDDVTAGEVDRCRIHMPPRHAKSETVTLRYPIYYVEHINPQANILVTAHTDNLSKKFGRRIRRLLHTHGIQVSPEQRAADTFETMSGARFVCRGVGAPPTGEGFDLIIIDDPYKSADDANSDAVRAHIEEWFFESIYTRLAPGGKIIMVFTRWHHGDLAGKLDENVKYGGDQYTILNMPAINEIGHALWERMFDADALKRIQANIGPRAFNAQYQQNPTPADGDMLQVQKLKYCEATEVPQGLNKIRGWDFGYSISGDPTAGILIEGPDALGNFYLTNVQRFTLPVGDRNARIGAVLHLDGPNTMQIFPDDPAAGAAQTEQLKSLFAGSFLRFEKPLNSKVERAAPLAALIDTERLIVVRSSWTPEIVSEFQQFPLGKHDDMVDGAATSYNAHARMRSVLL